MPIAAPLHGLIAAPHTPLHADGSLALSRIAKLSEHLQARSIVGVFVNGTTGEGQCQTTAERKATAAAWAEHKGPLHCIVNIAAQAQGDMVELAQHAATVAVHGVAATAPSFHRPRSQDDLVAMLLPVAAAAERPFWLYHIPGLTHVGLDPVATCAALHERCPTFAGVKFTAPDLLALQRMLAAARGRWQVAWGVDELMLPALAVGARAFVGSTYNYAAPSYQRLIAAFERGDLESARAISRQIQPLLDLLERGPIRVGKALVSCWGLDLGPSRPPERPFTEHELQDVRALAAKLELLADAPHPGVG
jgi:N-acetylneuraminate lyase